MAPAAAPSEASTHAPGRRHDRQCCSRCAAAERAHHLASTSDLGWQAAVSLEHNVLSTVLLIDSSQQPPAASLLDQAQPGAGA